MNKRTGIVVFIYGLLLVVGGFIGHLKAHSKASLVCGLLFGLLTLGSAVAILKGKRAGYAVALVVTLILDAFFTYRYLQSARFMPSGMMSVLSLVVLVILYLALRKSKS